MVIDKKFIGMTEIAKVEDIRSAKIGQWIKVHWCDVKPTWCLISDKAKRGNKYIEVFDPKTGCNETVYFDQISKIGDMILLPKN